MERCCGGRFTTEKDGQGGHRVICANGFPGGCGGLSLDDITRMDAEAGTKHGARPQSGILFLDAYSLPITSRTSRNPRNAVSTRRVE